MEFHVIIFTSYLLLAHAVGVNGFPMDDLISKLPGQPDVHFRQFSGYIDVDDGGFGPSLFYYFVEAEKDPMNQPLTIWLTGGPGCSSVGDGFSSVGPFVTTRNARALEKNLFSWNKVSNLLFIDSPIGCGWSYSNTISDYNNGDDSTTKILVSFMQKWYGKYPEFKSRDVFLAGSSYAGHFVPNLANALLDHNKQSKDFKFNVKGLALGNPLLRKKLDALAMYDYFHSIGLVNNTVYEQAKKECKTLDENNYSSKFETNWTKPCNDLIENAPFIAFNSSDRGYVISKRFDVQRDPCDMKKLNDLSLGKELTKVSHGADMCAAPRAQFYFNLPEVQKAFHGNRTSLSYSWKGCYSDKFKFNENDKNRDMLPALKRLLQQSVHITIFSGDVDALVPAVGTLQHLYKLAEDLNIKSTKEETWSYENKDGGRKYSFGDLLTFFIVKGGDHHVTFSQPSQALYIFTNFTINRIHNESSETRRALGTNPSCLL
ncbi:putative Pyridoxal phosphate phosphatase-related protein [Hibiscus syriacus]|uniref:Pyridoxal phosphate phosphatase-related protein n=2 Tax=Hibiscus syriacus TaxID=106335 RepID=A0A6A2YXL5_HIBSY|nr:putative Pyridoxal phosphate phosphatase-related protein [Hibiscus syriacus]